MYEAMARRYRPATFDEVIGQEHVAQTLKNAITTDRVAHAYLFCGPHGCGKTSMARIFARALVCEEGPTATPCGKCDFCRDIMRGQDTDVREIDGASNNKVDEVRQLREQVGYVPTRARYKIYIIDEVHMLSVAAFNALLKTLEEPPPHVKFILATTDPHKLLDTVLSRCQRFDFRLVPPPKLSAFFKTLVDKEGARITTEAVEAVAAFSGGSVRDGLVLLDQLLSFSQGEVTREDVERVRGVAGAESVAGLFERIVAHDIKSALAVVDEVAQRGTNVGDFLDQLIEFGRDLMMLVATGDDEGVSAYGPARESLDRLAQAVTLDHVLLMLDVLAQARTRVRSRALTNPMVPLEMAVARLSGLDNLQPVGEIIQKLDALARGAPLPMPTANPVSVAATPQPDMISTQEDVSSKSAVELESRAKVASSIDPQPETQGEQNVDADNDPIEAESCSVEDDSPPWNDYDAGDESSGYTEEPVDDEVYYGEGTDVSSGLVDSVEILGEDGLPAQVDNGSDYPLREAVSDEIETSSPPAVSAVEKISGTDASLWNAMLNMLDEQGSPDLTYLKDVSFGGINGDVLSLKVRHGSFALEMLDDPRRKARLAQVAKDICGMDYIVRFDSGAEDVSSGINRLSGGPSPEQRKKNQAQSDPGVQMLVDSFKGRIVNVRTDKE